MYNAFYGFSEKPFEVTPDPAFLYLTPSHHEAFDAMIDGIKNRWGFVSITGEVGTGKTTLVHALLSRLDEKVKTVLIFHPTITFKELLRAVLLELGFIPAEKSEESFLNQLSDYLSNHLESDETVAVILDEAQGLSEEVIKKFGKLSELEPQISVRLQIIFVGQPEFDEKLNLPGLRQIHRRIGVRRKIEALSEKESREYIEHRLKIVGSSSLAVFTSQAISLIVKHAQGIPRMINILCDNAFLNGYSSSVRRIDADIIGEIISNLEGQSTQKVNAPKILKAVKSFHLLSFKSNRFQTKFLVAFLCLFVLAGLILLTYRSLQRNPTITGSIESIKRYPMDAGEISSNSLPPQAMTKEVSKDIDPSSERNPGSQGLVHPGTPPSSAPSPEGEKGELEDVIVVEEGQTISSLAQRYYHRTNPTLVDFILDFNPEINNAHLIQVNQRIRIPKIVKEWLINPSFDRTYRLHVGTSWTPDFAKPYRGEPALKGKGIEILPRRVSPKDTWYRVMVGPFDNKNEVLKVIDLLKGKGLLPLFGGVPGRKLDPLDLGQVMGDKKKRDLSRRGTDADNQKNSKEAIVRFTNGGVAATFGWPFENFPTGEVFSMLLKLNKCQL